MTLEFLPAHVIRNLSAKQIEDIEEVELRKKIIDGQINELDSLIESNKPAIDAVKTECFHDVYTARKTEIEKHLETLSPQVAYAYLVNYEIELSKDAPADDDYSGLSRHYRKQIDLLKSGDVRAFVVLRDKYLNAKYFRDICLRKLLSEYKKRAEALPDPTGSGKAEPGAGKQKKGRALKNAVPIEQVGEGKPYLKKKISLAYEDLRREICFRKHTIDSLRKGIDDQSTGYEKYRRIKLISNKPDTKHFAYKNPEYKP